MVCTIDEREEGDSRDWMPRYGKVEALTSTKTVNPSPHHRSKVPKPFKMGIVTYFDPAGYGLWRPL
jgi:hypothetical protein